MQSHVKIVAVLFAVFGALGIVFALFSSAILGLLAAVIGATHEEGAPLGAAVFGLTGAMLGIFFFVLSVPSLICSWGLLKLRPWARILGIILAAISLLRIPLGTIFGIYALWVLFSKRTEALFGREVVKS